METKSIASHVSRCARVRLFDEGLIASIKESPKQGTWRSFGQSYEFIDMICRSNTEVSISDSLGKWINCQMDTVESAEALENDLIEAVGYVRFGKEE